LRRGIRENGLRKYNNVRNERMEGRDDLSWFDFKVERSVLVG
jgi:hypothetical protein